MDPYEQLPDRPVIRVRWPHGGWIVWNWTAARWDHH
jgi:hypothetical protein